MPIYPTNYADQTVQKTHYSSQTTYSTNYADTTTNSTNYESDDPFVTQALFESGTLILLESGDNLFYE